MTTAAPNYPMAAIAPGSPLGDEEVVARVRAGEVALFEVIMRRYNQRLFRAARAIVRDDDEAEDVLQESYLQAFAHLDGFAGRSRLSTWLTRIVIHEAYRRVRRRRPTLDIDTAAEPVASHTPESAVAGREMATLLSGAIDRLPEPFRLVFMLRVVQRMDVAETAACLDLAETTVKTRLHRARKMLREELEQAMELGLPEVHAFLGERCDRVVSRVLARLGAS